MKEKDKLEELLICDCSSAEHQLIFTGDEFTINDEVKRWVFVTTHLTPQGFWKRVWFAIKYIFGYKCKYGHFEEVILTDKHIEKLENIVNYLKWKEK